jgi:hypothetical protein
VPRTVAHPDDLWQKDLKNPDSVASRLWARFGKCGKNVARRGYDAY